MLHVNPNTKIEMVKQMVQALNLSWALLAGMAVMNSSFAQTGPTIDWQTTLGGSQGDGGSSVAPCMDGGYITLSSITSTNGIAAANHGGYDLLVAKLNANGSVAWSRCLGGTGNEYAGDIEQTSDGGYIFTAGSNSSDGDVTENHGGNDLWLVKLDENGEIVWQKSLGGTSNDGSGRKIRQTNDGGYFAIGTSYSNDGDATGAHGSADYWVLRLDAEGTPIWTRLLGGTGDDEAEDLRITSDGGCIIIGTTGSMDGDVTLNHGAIDAWVVKLDASGTIQWQKSYGGSDIDNGWAIEITNAGGYIIGVEAFSNDGEVSVNHGLSDFWIVNLDSAGTIIWESSYGGSNFDQPIAICPTNDGGFAINGGTTSQDGDVTNYHGGLKDCWTIKVDQAGTLIWQSTFGGSEWDFCGDIHLTPDGGYVFIGSTLSDDGDITMQHGLGDAWVVKLSPDMTGISELDQATDISVHPNPALGQVTFKCTLSTAGPVRLSVLNTDGQLVLKPVNERTTPGVHEWHLDASGLAHGVYLLRFISDGQVFTRRLVRD